MVVVVDPPFGRHSLADSDTGKLTPAFGSNKRFYEEKNQSKSTLNESSELLRW